MAELTASEFHEIRTRQSIEDFKHLLALLERDEEIVLVDDPAPIEILADEDDDEADAEAEADDGDENAEPAVVDPDAEAPAASEAAVVDPDAAPDGLGAA